MIKNLFRYKFQYCLLAIFNTALYSQHKDMVLDSDIDVLPVLINESNANYPDTLIKENVEGTVLLELLIDETGEIDSVKIVDSLHPMLDSLSVNAAKDLRFSPAKINDESVAVILQYEYKFSIDDVIKNVDRYKNYTGVILEKGTRKRVENALITVSYCDTCIKSSNSLNVLERKLSFKKYIETIGKFENQWIENNSIITQSDSLGRFSFFSLPIGDANVKIIAQGYLTQEFKNSISYDSTIDVLIRVKKEDYHDLQMMIYGKKENNEVIQRVLNIKEIKSVPGFSKDVVKAVQTLPGVARPSYGGEDISIRGADPTQNKYYFEGISVPYLWHFDVYGVNSIMNSNVIDDMSLLSGGFGSSYGNVLGGVLSFTSRDVRNDMAHGVFDLGVTNTSITLEIPIYKNIGALVSLRRDYIMSVLNFASKQIYGEETGFGGYYADYFFKLHYQPNKKNEVFGIVFGSKDTLFEETDEFDESQIDNEDVFCKGKKFTQLILGWDFNLKNFIKNKLRVGIRNVDKKDKYYEYFHIKQDGYVLEVRDELTIQINDDIKIFGGLDIRSEPIKMSMSINFNDTIIEHFKKMNEGPFGAFIGLNIKSLKKFEIKPEFRIDYFPDPHYNGSILPEFWDYDFNNTTKYSVEPTFRISTKYKLNDFHTFKFSAGTYNQNSSDIIVSKWQSNDLKLTKGSQFTLGYEGYLNNHILISVDGYINNQWDKRRYSTEEELEKDPLTDVRSGGKARMKGLEFLVKYERKKRLSGWITYTLAHSERYDSNVKKWELYDGDLRHNFQIVADWKLKRGVTFGTRFHITDGLPYTPKVVQYYDSDYSYYEYIEGEKNSERHNAYLGLDLRLDKTFTLKRSLLTFYLESIRTLHWLGWINKKDGTPIYAPKESNSYYYDYSGFVPDINVPLPGAGFEIKF